MKQPLTVLVTGVGGGGHGEQILKALKLAQTEYRIIGADMSAYSKGLLEVDHAELLPPASDPNYISQLKDICRKYEVAALFHGSEPELRAMSRHEDELRESGLFLPINPPKVINICSDKNQTCEFLQRAGFTVPISEKITSVDQLRDFDRLPAVLKPSIGGGGSANLFLAQTSDELKFFGEHLLSIYSEFVVQEYVGTPDSEFTVGVLSDMNGSFINSIAVKRNILSSLSNRLKIPNRTGNPDLGPVLAISNGVSQGQIGRFPEVTETCEDIAKALGSRGAINIQCRLFKGAVYVFEINPRFSGTTSLRAMVGYNEPDILIRKHLLGEEIAPRFAYQSGMIVRGLSEAFVGNHTGV